MTRVQIGKSGSTRSPRVCYGSLPGNTAHAPITMNVCVLQLILIRPLAIDLENPRDQLLFAPPALDSLASQNFLDLNDGLRF